MLNPRGIANSWTFYIGRDDKILAIDKTVRPESSNAELIAQLKELRVAPTH